MPQDPNAKPEVEISPTAIAKPHNEPRPERAVFVRWGNNLVVSVEPKLDKVFADHDTDEQFTVTAVRRSTFQNGTITLVSKLHTTTQITGRFTVVSRI